MTNFYRTLAVGNEIERELCDEVDYPRENPKPAQHHLTIDIDGALSKRDAVLLVSDDSLKSSLGASKGSVAGQLRSS